MKFYKVKTVPSMLYIASTVQSTPPLAFQTPYSFLLENIWLACLSPLGFPFFRNSASLLFPGWFQFIIPLGHLCWSNLAHDHSRQFVFFLFPRLLFLPFPFSPLSRCLCRGLVSIPYICLLYLFSVRFPWSFPNFSSHISIFYYTTIMLLNHFS